MDDEEGGLLPFRLLINNGSAKLSSEIRGAGKRIKEHGSVEKSTGLAKGYCSLPDRVSETEEWILHSRMDARNKREKMKKKTRKKRKKGRGGREKWRKELSDESRLHSSAIQRAAPRCRARVKQCARPFTEWKHGRRRGVDGNARRLAASNPANCSVSVPNWTERTRARSGT